jgi:hypothetical protein
LKIIHRNDTVHSARTRDAALRRLGSANRWLIAGSAVLTGVLTDVAANAFPGHTVQKGTAGSHASKRAGHKALSAPAQAPKPAVTPEAEPEAEVAPEAEAAPETEVAPETEAETEQAPVEEAPQAEAEAPVEEEPVEPVVSGGS